MTAVQSQLLAAVPPVVHRWRLDFATPYGASYWCEVSAPTALQAVTAALHHGADRPGASTMFHASSITIQQLAGDFTN